MELYNDSGRIQQMRFCNIMRPHIQQNWQAVYLNTCYGSAILSHSLFSYQEGSSHAFAPAKYAMNRKKRISPKAYNINVQQDGRRDLVLSTA